MLAFRTAQQHARFLRTSRSLQPMHPGTMSGTAPRAAAAQQAANAKCQAKPTAQRTYHEDIDHILYTEDTLKNRIGELGKQIAQDYADKAPLVLGVLKGCILFTADLLRAIEPCPRGLTMDFIKASSYGAGTESTGEVTLKTDLDARKVKGRHVILVEDIVDTGLTISTVSQHIMAQGAASVVTATLLDKKERRVLNYAPEYVGFVCPNEFVVGYGLDYDEEYRTLPYIGVLKPEMYQS